MDKTIIKDEINIIDDNLDNIIDIVKNNLPEYEPETDARIVRALGTYFE